MSRAATPAISALVAAGVPHEVLTYRHDARTESYGDEAVAALPGRRLPTVVDASALQFERMLCSAGKRGWDIAVAPHDLTLLTGAVVADIRAT